MTKIKQNTFKAKLVKELSNDKNKAKLVMGAVFSCCVESGFLSLDDRENQTNRYIWFKEVFWLNLHSLSLLETIMVSTYTPLNPEDIDMDVKAKSTAIIKDIAKRLINYPVPITSEPTGKLNSISKNYDDKVKF
ncbi:hypothetical protein ACFL5R_01920 [Pseudomonadota bacterium]